MALDQVSRAGGATSKQLKSLDYSACELPRLSRPGAGGGDDDGDKDGLEDGGRRIEEEEDESRDEMKPKKSALDYISTQKLATTSLPARYEIPPCDNHRPLRFV